MDIIYRTTKKHFKSFQQEILRLQSDWGIHGWAIEFEHIKLPPEFLAQVERDFGQGQVLISFAKYWALEPTPEKIREIAKHEMLHIVLGRLRVLAMIRFCAEEELDASEHEIVNILEKLIP